MRIAVVGSGISGLASAWLLSRDHEVTLFEAQDYLGGHTHTHRIESHGREYAVDTGFIVYNTRNYPLLTQLFEQLGVESQATTMSFSVLNRSSGLEYNATSLNGLFCQRRNLLSPRFLGMLRDLLRFYREAPRAVLKESEGVTLEEYLSAHRYGSAFREDHLIPMACALWSCPRQAVLQFPVSHLLQFMANHQMLQVTGRPQWRVVKGGSSSYVAALRARWKVTERLRSPVRAVRRTGTDVEVRTDQGGERFDHVVLACHCDQTLGLLSDPSQQEHEILGGIPYQTNDVVLHTDRSVLPKNPRAWAAWNALIPQDPASTCSVSYCMNILQGLDSLESLIVSLNATEHIDPRKIIKRMTYEHPVFSREALIAQKRKGEIQGDRRTWFAGAYWGWGFHEDGMRSAVEIARAFRVKWPCEPSLSQSHDRPWQEAAA
jgi:predicted NAD/FAD-binding protein